MNRGSVEIPCYVRGEFRHGLGELAPITEFDGKPWGSVRLADYWMIESAIATASGIHHQLRNVPYELIVRILSRAMDSYFATEESIDTVVRLTGSPRNYVVQSLAEMKDWCRDLSSFTQRVTGREREERLVPSAPVVVVLPGNSEAESLYCIAQCLLSGNAAIVRPSTAGAGAFTAWEYVKAFHAAIDAECSAGIGDLLRRAVSVLYIPGRDYMKQLAVYGWNYVVFGSSATVGAIESTLAASGVRPRKIIGYGTGLSTSIVLGDVDVPTAAERIAESIIVNAGNDCTATSVIYVDEGVALDFRHELDSRLAGLTKISRTDSSARGYYAGGNFDYVQGEIGRRLNVSYSHECDSPDSGGIEALPAVIDLHAFEHATEYPGPVASIRTFQSMADLDSLMLKDLRENGIRRNLACAIYTRSEEAFRALWPTLSTCTVRLNKPTHQFNPGHRHHGVYLLEELSDRVWVES